MNLMPSGASPPRSPRVSTSDPPVSSYNHLIRPLLTDLYQITMCYAYWKSERHAISSAFDLFFRKSPFGGEFTIFAGLSEVLAFVDKWRLDESDILYLREEMLPHAEPEFFDYLRALDCSEVRVYSVHEGSVVFPREPLMRIEGPLGICQLLETTILNLTNFASLVCTNAARMRKAAGDSATLLEFGLRRAQGPDGAVSASRYAYMGGFDGTSNVLAGQLFGMPVKGTHAHAFVCSFSGIEDLLRTTLRAAPAQQGRSTQEHDILKEVIALRRKFKWTATNMGELCAFISYAQAFPNGFLALIDTYDTLCSGVRNFLLVAYVLHQLGYAPIGVRLDSGDLAWLSLECRAIFETFAREHDVPSFARLKIVASNDINESILVSLQDQGHSIDAFGIGTNLVTCQAQPALGMVYKLVEIDGKPRIKLSNDISKITIPGRKNMYRLIGKKGIPLIDVILKCDESPPEPGKKMLCCHPFDAGKRVYVTPAAVLPLIFCWRKGMEAQQQEEGDESEEKHGASALFLPPSPSLDELRNFTKDQLQMMRPDHLRAVNPTPYKIAVSVTLHSFLHDLWAKEQPIAELE